MSHPSPNGAYQKPTIVAILTWDSSEWARPTNPSTGRTLAHDAAAAGVTRHAPPDWPFWQLGTTHTRWTVAHEAVFCYALPAVPDNWPYWDLQDAEGLSVRSLYESLNSQSEQTGVKTSDAMEPAESVGIIGVTNWIATEALSSFAQ